jgi:hypothetical protein
VIAARRALIRTQNFRTRPPALSIAGLQDERWPAAAFDGVDLRLDAGQLLVVDRGDR